MSNESSDEELSFEVPTREEGKRKEEVFDNLVSQHEKESTTKEFQKKKLVRLIQRLLTNNKGIVLHKKNKEYDSFMEKSYEELEEILADLKDQLSDQSGFPMTNALIDLLGPLFESKCELEGFIQDLKVNTIFQLKMEEGLESYFPEKFKFIYEYLNATIQLIGCFSEAKERYKKRKREEEEMEIAKRQKREDECFQKQKSSEKDNEKPSHVERHFETDDCPKNEE